MSESAHLAVLPEEMSFSLDLTNPIDRIINNYRETQEGKDPIAHAWEQWEAVEVFQGDTTKTNALISTCKELIAAVAYPLKDQGLQSRDLLIIGRAALLDAALTFDQLATTESFRDYALSTIRNAIYDGLGWESVSEGENQSYEDMTKELLDRGLRSKLIQHTTLHVVEDEQPQSSPVAEAPESPPVDQRLVLIGELGKQLRDVNQRRASEDIAQLGPVAREILPVLHLRNAEIARQKQPLTIVEVNRTIESALGTLGLRRKLDLARVAIEAGVTLDIHPAPSIDKLSILHRQVASRLGQSDVEIASDLNLTHSQLRTVIGELYVITDATNRTELAVMSQVNKFQPSPQEIEAALPHEALRGFKPHELKILTRLYLPVKEIVADLGPPVTYYGVRQTIIRMRQKLGIKTTEGLALEIQRRGFEYNILPLEKPLAELVDPDILDLLANGALAQTNEEIAEGTPYTSRQVARIVMAAKSSLKARSRAELALMIEANDTGERGERRDPTIPAREYKLAGLLGLTPPIKDAVEILKPYATSRQNLFTMEYYMSNTPPEQWQEISERHEVAPSTASLMSRLGIKRWRAALKAGLVVIDRSKTAIDT